MTPPVRPEPPALLMALRRAMQERDAKLATQRTAQDSLRTLETTRLTPGDEYRFKVWTGANGITDVDDPRSLYDYRGYFRDVVLKGGDQRKAYDDGLHFPDTYKQHGHPTFSVESRYSMGPNDGGRWGGPDGETYIPSAKPQTASSLLTYLRQLAKKP